MLAYCTRGHQVHIGSSEREGVFKLVLEASSERQGKGCGNAEFPGILKDKGVGDHYWHYGVYACGLSIPRVGEKEAG